MGGTSSGRLLQAVAAPPCHQRRRLCDRQAQPGGPLAAIRRLIPTSPRPTVCASNTPFRPGPAAPAPVRSRG